MANPFRGEADLLVSGKVYKIKFGINAMCELEDALDRPISQILEELGDEKRVRMKTVRAILWAGLQEYQLGFTQETAGDIASIAGIDEVMKAIGAALGAAAPEETEGDKTARPPKKSSRLNG